MAAARVVPYFRRSAKRRLSRPRDFRSGRVGGERVPRMPTSTVRSADCAAPPTTPLERVERSKANPSAAMGSPRGSERPARLRAARSAAGRGSGQARGIGPQRGAEAAQGRKSGRFPFFKGRGTFPMMYTNTRCSHLLPVQGGMVCMTGVGPFIRRRGLCLSPGQNFGPFRLRREGPFSVRSLKPGGR